MTGVRLSVSEEIGVARSGEVVRCGVPVAAFDTRPLSVLVHGDVVPHQVLWRRAGWVGLAFPVSVGARSSVEVVVRPASSGGEVSAPLAAGVSGLRLTTGVVTAELGLSPFTVALPSLGVPAATVVLTGDDGVRHTAAVPEGGVTVTQSGPLVAEVELTGRYGTSWGFRARLTALAGASSVDLSVGIVNDDDAPESAVAEWAVELDAGRVDTAVCGVFGAAHRGVPPFAVQHRGEGHPRGIFATSRVVGGTDWRDASDPDYWSRWEWSELHGRQAVNWLVARRSDGADVGVAVHRFAENHPSDLAVAPSGVTVRFWPSDAGALRLTQGAAKTRLLRLTGGDDRRSGPVLDSPLVPALAGDEPGYLPYLPERYPNLESHIREELSGWYQSGQSLGFHDFGDSVQGITTGPRTGYSANNEHDALLALTLHYLRSGERAYFDSAQAYADHLCDVDLIHHSSQPHEVGGLRAHGRAHVHYVAARTPAGPVRTSIDTGHLWTEGLVLFGLVSGESRYVEAARRVADCIVGLVDLGWTRPEPGPRNSGWPLMALTAVARATGSSVYVDAASRTAKAALAAQHPDGRWLMRLGLADDYCAWQNAVLLIGLARLQALSPSAEVGAAFSAGARALLTLGRNRDGSFVYLSRFDYRWANRSALIREALALAFDAAGDDAFLRAGLAGGSRWYRPRGLAPALSNDVAEWRGHLPFLLRAHEAGLLTDLPEAG